MNALGLKYSIILNTAGKISFEHVTSFLSRCIYFWKVLKIYFSKVKVNKGKQNQRTLVKLCKCILVT